MTNVIAFSSLEKYFFMNTPTFNTNMGWRWQKKFIENKQSMGWLLMESLYKLSQGVWGFINCVGGQAGKSSLRSVFNGEVRLKGTLQNHLPRQFLGGA